MNKCVTEVQKEALSCRLETMLAVVPARFEKSQKGQC